jgi:RimJ/RimL family protein N-acetyltransferase
MDELQTERLQLRALTFDDAGFILRLVNEPSYLKYIGDKDVRTLDDARAYIEHGPMASREAHGFALDRVELRASGHPIGICGLLKREALDDVDVGYAFLPEFWSCGYASEAVRAVLANAKSRFGLTRVAAVVSSDNAGSVRLLEKLGFQYQRMIQLHEGEPGVRLYVLGLQRNKEACGAP